MIPQFSGAYTKVGPQWYEISGKQDQQEQKRIFATGNQAKKVSFEFVNTQYRFRSGQKRGTLALLLSSGSSEMPLILTGDEAQDFRKAIFMPEEREVRRGKSQEPGKTEAEKLKERVTARLGAWFKNLNLLLEAPPVDVSSMEFSYKNGDELLNRFQYS